MTAFLFTAAGLVAAAMLALLRPWRPQALGRRTTLLLAIGMPLTVTGAYALLGHPAALLAPPAASDAAHATPDIERMVSGLAARLEKNPSDTRGWAMLARSYHAMGRIDDAQAAFARIGDELNRDPVLLADYADVLAAQAGGRIDGRPLALVKTALQLDPDNAMALSLAATAAYQRHDFAEASGHWQRLLKQLPPESQEATWVAKTLVEIGATPAP